MQVDFSVFTTTGVRGAGCGTELGCTDGRPDFPMPNRSASTRKLRERIDAHLSHYLSADLLDILFARAKVESNLLVEATGYDVLHDLTLALGEAGQTGRPFFGLNGRLTPVLGDLQGGAHGAGSSSRM
jgi:hypothetical protein